MNADVVLVYTTLYMLMRRVVPSHEHATRFVSSVHASLMAGLSVYTISSFGGWVLDPARVLATHDPLARDTIEFMLGYLVYDTLVNLVHQYVFGKSVPFLVVYGHHALVAMALLGALMTPSTWVFTVLCCVQELSTPLYHLFWALKGNKPVGFAFVGAFFVTRMLWVPWCLLQASVYVMYQTNTESGITALLILGWIQTSLNGYWFGEIASRIRQAGQ